MTLLRAAATWRRASRSAVAALLVAVVAACTLAPPAPALDLSRAKLTRDARFHVELLAPDEGIAINRIQSWQLRLSTPDGAPISKALVYLNGDMPEHGHGMPTRPMTHGEVSPGTYRVDGVKLSMAGRWELVVAVQANGKEDLAYFNVVIALPPARPAP